MAKFVVIHNLVAGQFTRGQVIDDKALGASLGRCLDLGAVRPATAEESKHAAVAFPEQGRHLALESQLAEKDAEIERLRQRALDLESKLTAGSAAKAARPGEDARHIERLRARVEELEAAHAVARPEEQLTASVSPAPPEVEEPAPPPHGRKRHRHAREDDEQ